MSAAILEKVSFSYGKEPLFTDLSLTLPEKGFLTLIGPNGGGKSTLLRLLLGLERPRKGSLRVLGRSPEKAAARIGYVPQETGANRDFPLRVVDAVLAGRLASGGWGPFYSGEDKAKAREAMEKTGIADLEEKRMDQLSGGQRQRALIARALCGEPELLLLDEPVSSLDPENARKIYGLLKELSNTLPVLVVSHDLALLMGYADWTAYVNRGVHVHEKPPHIGQETLLCPAGHHVCEVELLENLRGVWKGCAC